MHDTANDAGMKKGVLERSIAALAHVPLLRYLLAIATVALAYLLRIVITHYVGNGLATYITFYPAIMVTAILAGFWPGILATALSALVVDLWVLPPYGLPAITSPVDLAGLILFSILGLLMSAFAHLYHHTRERATATLEASNEALRRSEERVRLILEGVRDYAIILLDPEGRVTSWNAGAERIKGYPAEEILGKPFDVFYTPEAIATGRPHAELQQALIEGRFEEEGWRVRKDGSRFWANVVITPLYTEEGALFGFVKVTRDISERRKAEEQLQALNADLLQRTAALETSSKELEDFSYSIAHDLRSPLRSLDGFSKYLLEHAADRLTAQEQDYLHRMRAAAQRMARLIDDLLNLARIGRTAMRPERVNLSNLAAEILTGLHRRDPQRRVVTEIAPDLIVHGDRSLLRIALEHLLDNAWKFTGTRAEARITVGMQRQDDTPVYYVRDNGVGFDMAYVNKLFQPFQRLHTEAEFPGTGIGLALIQRIVQRHGGRVWAEGEEGKGATIYFTLGETMP